MHAISVLLYNIFIRGYALAMRIAAVFNPKAASWVKGRESFPDFELPPGPRIWVHCASLGEFEQARPVIEKIKTARPESRIVLSFFSPSGYEVRKNYEAADVVMYLPLDTRQHAIRWLDAIRPELVLFVKYEFWYHYLTETHHRQIPLVLFSAVFRPEQSFFRWYGTLFRNMLRCFSLIFVQDTASQLLLQTISVPSEIAADTRFDRVLQIAEQRLTPALIDKFTADRPLLIAGSTWPADEDLIAACIHRQLLPGYKYLIAPHELQKERLVALRQQLSGQAVLFSELTPANAARAEVVIMDNYGLLASLYAYSAIAYIGGAFNAGVHNVLEAAVYGQPVIFGPHFQKSLEAHALLQLEAGFTVHNVDELQQVLSGLTARQNERLTHASTLAREYVKSHSGGTEKIYARLVTAGYL